LQATFTQSLPVRFFVRAEPAIVESVALRIKPIPPRARFAAAVTVVASQWGR
jgi:hypothetical protein